jgi:hypothetical protein
MANEKHLLLTAIGDWTDSALAGEAWQVGVRLALVFGGSVDPVGTFPSNWDPTALAINRTETNWTIQGNWDAKTGTNTFEPDDYLNDQAAPAFISWFGAISVISNKCRLRQLKLSPIGTNGKLVPAPPYSTGTPVVLDWTASYPVGINGGEILPLQIACAVSHRTAQVGRHGRGRMFVPGFTGSATNSHGVMSTGLATSIAASQASLLEALAYTSSDPTGARVRPVITGAPWTHYGVINQVRCGTVLDTQRRRRRSIAETYESQAVTY